jgi:hypothetical protein
MSRHSSIPTLFDECKTISITFLRKHNYLNQNNQSSGVMSWSRNGSTTGQISISVSMVNNPCLTLSYVCNGKPIKYDVRLISVPSNLGKGEVWYFVCPNTGKLCRKLYQGSIYFLHRDAFEGCFYDSQVQSHRNRALLKLYSLHFVTDKVYEERYRKYFKPCYNGKPTKRTLKLQQMLERYNTIKGTLPSEESLLLM